MGKPRSHHFVPQFYLRRFSDDGRSIRILNKSSDRIIEGASIKGQCAVDNFHGWHELAESTLATIEGACAASIDRLIRSTSPPAPNTTDYSNLLLFVALQSERTVQSADVSNLLTDKLAKMMVEGRPEFDDIDLDKFVIKEKFPVAMPIAVALEAFDYLRTLEMKILTAGGEWGFVTSDNPVVRYNASRADVWWEGVTGLDCEGLQIFLPLSRKICLYLFDPASYPAPANTPTRVLGLEDTLKINALTILNSGRNVYGQKRADLQRAQAIRTLTKPLEDFVRVAFVETESYAKEENQTASLFAHYRMHPPANFNFRFARTRGRPVYEGIRSDRSAAEPRRLITEGPGTRSLRVVTSTLNGSRIMISDAQIERLAKEIRRTEAWAKQGRSLKSSLALRAPAKASVH